MSFERGATRRPPKLNAADLARTQEIAAHVAERFGVKYVDRAALDQWCAESDARSLYLFDVRNLEEYEGGHVPGSRHAPGGQLVQNTDSYIGTRGARVVLIDDTGVRATMTASWLLQMGWKDTVVLRDGLDASDLETGVHGLEILGLDDVIAEVISPADLKRALDAGEATVIDLSAQPHVQGRSYSRGLVFDTA